MCVVGIIPLLKGGPQETASSIGNPQACFISIREAQNSASQGKVDVGVLRRNLCGVKIKAGQEVMTLRPKEPHARELTCDRTRAMTYKGHINQQHRHDTG